MNYELTDIEKAIKHFKSVSDGAKVILDAGFGTEPHQHPLLYEKRKLYADMAVEALEKWIPKKPIGDLHSVPHYRCPSCKNAVKVYEDSVVQPQCHYCNQKLDWE